MRLFIILVSILLSCNTVSKDSMRKEYDSVLLQQQQITEYIKGTEDIRKTVLKDESLNAYYTAKIDSLTIVNEKLDKSRKELAAKLFQ